MKLRDIIISAILVTPFSIPVYSQSNTQIIKKPSVQIRSTNGLKVGQTTTIICRAEDKGINSGFKRGKLLMDGEELEEGEYTCNSNSFCVDDNYFMISNPVDTKETKSIDHTYRCVFWDRDGNKAKSQPLQVHYSGEVDDRKPIVEMSSSNGLKVGQTTEIEWDIDDLGDNSGIRRVVLLEDKLVESFKKDCGFFCNGREWFIHKSSEKHSYILEVTDIGGNTVSKKLEVEYSGIIDDRIPTIKLSPLELQVSGEAELLTIARDTGDNAGFDKFTLYENGKKLRTWNFYDLPNPLLIRNTVGTFTYEMEVIDRGGHKVKSKPVTIKFNP